MCNVCACYEWSVTCHHHVSLILILPSDSNQQEKSHSDLEDKMDLTLEGASLLDNQHLKLKPKEVRRTNEVVGSDTVHA